MSQRGEMVPITVQITREQREWLRFAAEDTGQPEDALVSQGIQILRRISSYRALAGRFARRFIRGSPG